MTRDPLGEHLRVLIDVQAQQGGESPETRARLQAVLGDPASGRALEALMREGETATAQVDEGEYVFAAGFTVGLAVAERDPALATSLRVLLGAEFTVVRDATSAIIAAATGEGQER